MCWEPQWKTIYNEVCVTVKWDTSSTLTLTVYHSLRVMSLWNSDNYTLELRDGEREREGSKKVFTFFASRASGFDVREQKMTEKYKWEIEWRDGVCLMIWINSRCPTINITFIFDTFFLFFSPQTVSSHHSSHWFNISFQHSTSIELDRYNFVYPLNVLASFNFLFFWSASLATLLSSLNQQLCYLFSLTLCTLLMCLLCDYEDTWTCGTNDFDMSLSLPLLLLLHLTLWPIKNNVSSHSWLSRWRIWNSQPFVFHWRQMVTRLCRSPPLSLLWKDIHWHSVFCSTSLSVSVSVSLSVGVLRRGRKAHTISSPPTDESFDGKIFCSICIDCAMFFPSNGRRATLDWPSKQRTKGRESK